MSAWETHHGKSPMGYTGVGVSFRPSTGMCMVPRTNRQTQMYLDSYMVLHQDWDFVQPLAAVIAFRATNHLLLTLDRVLAAKPGSNNLP